MGNMVSLETRNHGITESQSLKRGEALEKSITGKQVHLMHEIKESPKPELLRPESQKVGTYEYRHVCGWLFSRKSAWATLANAFCRLSGTDAMMAD